jgi:hypothetical protein
MNPPGFDRILNWATDFLGTPDPQSGEDAFTQTRTFWRSDGVHVTATIDIDRNASWVVPGQQTDNLLRHEQGHYDITALAVRDFVNRASAADPESAWDDLFGPGPLHNTGRCGAMQVLYDSAMGIGTNGSRNAANQTLWTMKLKNLKSRPDGGFAELERWASMMVTLPAVEKRRVAPLGRRG